MKPKFDFFEKVKVSTRCCEKREIDGQLGAVLGRVQRESGDWYYAVHIYDTSESWDLYEHELASIGEFDKRETFYSDDQVRVVVDESGRGDIAED